MSAKVSDAYAERAGCPVYTALGVIGGRWKPMIYERLTSRAHGFGELRRAMPRVSKKVLREQLRQMEADGLVRKHTRAGPVVAVRYRLTPYGHSLAPVFRALAVWGRRHLERATAVEGTIVRSPATTSQ
jgi:DNA-binding HxlR family transcriptional regulator